MQTQRFAGTAHATLTVDGARHYVYHSTGVVIVNADRTIRLDSGGWRTATTMRAMNQASNQDELGFKVMQRAKKWWVLWQQRMIPFTDGMTLANVPVEV
jgi:hypothetical protein